MVPDVEVDPPLKFDPETDVTGVPVHDPEDEPE